MDFTFEAPTGSSFKEASGEDLADSKLIVLFENKPIRNESKSKIEGRPIYDSFEWITIIIPGDKNSVFSTKLSDTYRQRFSSRYAKWKEKATTVIEGTPLDGWPALEITQISALKEQKIFTVEQLAGLNEQFVKNLGPNGWELIKKARAFLDFSKGAGRFEQVQVELDRAKVENDALRKEMAELKALVIANSKPQQEKKTKLESAAA